jgi:hypothetical protein
MEYVINSRALRIGQRDNHVTLASAVALEIDNLIVRAQNSTDYTRMRYLKSDLEAFNIPSKHMTMLVLEVHWNIQARAQRHAQGSVRLHYR